MHSGHFDAGQCEFFGEFLDQTQCGSGPRAVGMVEPVVDEHHQYGACPFADADRAEPLECGAHRCRNRFVGPWKQEVVSHDGADRVASPIAVG